jgi:pseudaminic acid cytidylyltransferase
MSAVAIIPARGGSKRIPKKNIKDFLGKPIIAYSIETALESGLFDKVVVSTDSEEISKVALKYGADIIERPEAVSNDYVAVDAVILHAEKVLRSQGKHYDFECTIYATAPFMRMAYLQAGYDALTGSDAVYAFSAAAIPFPVQRTFQIINNRCEMFYPEHFSSRSQDLKEAYQDAGQFYWKNNSYHSNENIFGKDSIPIIIPGYLVQDIDTAEDWQRAEIMYKVLQEANL